MTSMKTTLDLPDDLMIAAKKRAAEQRTTLRALVARSLRRELSLRSDEPDRVVKIDWEAITVEGELPPELDLSSREAMYEWFDKHDG